LPKLPAEELQRRRKAIAEAARSCFLRKGVDGTSMDDVCSAAGLSKGAIYWHFPSKGALVLEVLDLGAEAMERLRSPGSWDEFRELLLRYPFHGPFSHEMALLEFELVTQAQTDAELRDRLRRNIEFLESTLRAALHSFVTRKVIRLRVPEAAATRTIMATMLGSLWWRALSEEPVQNVTAGTLDVLLQAIVEPLAPGTSARRGSK
jgi:AcrR family transcriptional regulator